MKKRIGRRLVSLLLTVVTILTMLPAMTLPALAAESGSVGGLTDEDIGLSFSGDVETPWSANGTTVSGSVLSTKGLFITFSHDSTLTIKNKKGTKATLSFNYAIVQGDGTIKVDGDPKTKNGEFSKDLEIGGEVNVYIKSGSTATKTMITITDIKLVSAATATVTFQPAENGSYTVDGKAIPPEYTHTQSSTTAYQVEAKPAPGYQFMDWYDVSNNKSISRLPKAELNIEKDCTIKARFTTSGLALFETGGLVYDDLTNAITAASGKPSALITQVGDGTVSGIYTIPSGVTLLIPFDEAGTLYTETPQAIRTAPQAKPYKTLTMAAGSSITLARGAAISVGGQYYAASGNQKGQIVGYHGYIKMESGSAITVQGGASLYAWGFISGSGSVTVQSGGSVYEWYQILDFRGGSASSNMGNKVFPFNQYAVQNIEAPLTLYTGATEIAYTTVFANSKINSTPVQFIGINGLFKLNSGSLTKAYDGSTDRIIYTIDGTAELNSLSISLGPIATDSKNFVLPLNNNMTVNLTSGSKLTVNQSVALLPGVEVSIAKGAELTVSSGKSMFIYDVDEWGSYCGGGNNNSTFIPVVYAPGRTGTRARLADAKIDVNGLLQVTKKREYDALAIAYYNHDIYTTESGANICSSEGTGKYIQLGNCEKSDKFTYQYDGSTTAHEIPITPAKLQNAAGDPTPTAGSVANDTFTYCTCPHCGGGKWTKNLQVAEIVKNDGTQGNTYETLQKAVDNLKADQYIKLLHNTTEKTINVNNKSLYLDLNGRTVTGDISVTNGYKLYGMDNSSKEYIAPSGKIVGTVTGYATTYETPPVKVGDVDTYDRYVAIPGTEENGTLNLSFHHFNISVTGYRFELAAPQCALFFIGKFQGDKAAKDYLTSLGFTLKGEDGRPLGEDNYELPADKDIPPEAEPGESPVVRDADGAFLFEVHLKRSFEKDPDATASEEFSAIAHATFDNGEKQDSKPQKLSFQEAWQNALSAGMADKDKEILKNFFIKFGINIKVE